MKADEIALLMLVILLALISTAFLNLDMVASATNCKSLKVAHNERCVVCRKPGDAYIRKKFGRCCLTAKSLAEQTSTSDVLSCLPREEPDALSCSPCEEQTAPSCSCCSSTFVAGLSAGASRLQAYCSPLQLQPRRPPLTWPSHCVAGFLFNPDRSDGNDQEEPQAMVAGSNASVSQAPVPHSFLGVQHPQRAALDRSAVDKSEEAHATAASGSPEATEPSKRATVVAALN